MYKYMNDHPEEWQEVDGATAQMLANAGSLVIAAQGNPSGHGHVCIVRPGRVTYSGKWLRGDVPKVANVSRPEFCRIDRGANFAFAESPQYYALKKFNP